MKPPLRSHTLAKSPVTWTIFLCVLIFPYEVSTFPFLYSSLDNIWSVNSKSLTVILGSHKDGKLLQFMNSFNNDSVQFAPTFRSLARDLYSWRELLSVQYLNCGDEVNVKICEDYQILKTPTLRYFPPGYRMSPRYLGDEIPTKNPKRIKDVLLRHIEKSQQSVRGAAIYTPLTGSDNLESIVETRQLYEGRPLKYVVLVFQPTESRIGFETILELSSIPYLNVRFLKNRRIFNNFGLNSTDQDLAIVDRGGNGLWLTPAQETGRAYANAVRQYLQYFNQKPEETLAAKSAKESAKDSAEKFQASLNQKIFYEARDEPKRVYRADLECGIQRLIYVELGSRPSAFAAENLTALVEFFDVLRSLNPLNKNAERMFIELKKAVTNGSNITGKLIADTATLAELRGTVFRSEQYIGCFSARVSFRGYPCSLWTLFHYWTVENAMTDSFAPGTILKRVRQFVRHLFTCPGCAVIYENVVRRLGMDQVSTHNQEILWLWSAHNEINSQLAGKSSEDLMFPKIQFPSPESCPTCRGRNGEWQNDQVLKYLKGLYDSDNFSFLGVLTAV